jgi:hypothetical protein
MLQRAAAVMIVVVVCSAACTAALGIDGDYEPLPDDGSSSSAGGSSAGGGSVGGSVGVGGSSVGGTGAGGNGGSAGAQPLGAPCRGNGDCASNSCPPDDGICCDTPCNGVCRGCAAAKTGVADGTCTPIPAYDDPDAECNATKACDGVNTCKNLDGETCNSNANCISDNCSDGTC